MKFPDYKLKLLYIVKKLGEVRGRKKFQKLVFLSKLEKWDVFPFRFIIYFNGPYSHELRDVIDDLIINGYLSERPESYRINPYDYEDRLIYIYTLRKKGLSMLEKYPVKDREVLDVVLKRYGNKNGEELEKITLEILGVKKKSEVFEMDVEDIIKSRRSLFSVS